MSWPASAWLRECVSGRDASRFVEWHAVAGAEPGGPDTPACGLRASPARLPPHHAAPRPPLLPERALGRVRAGLTRRGRPPEPRGVSAAHGLVVPRRGTPGRGLGKLVARAVEPPPVSLLLRAHALARRRARHGCSRVPDLLARCRRLLARAYGQCGALGASSRPPRAPDRLRADHALRGHIQALRGLSEELRNGIRPGQSGVGILVAPLRRGAARPLDHLDAESARLDDRGGGRPPHAA